jgi:hypothetical protein
MKSLVKLSLVFMVAMSVSVFGEVLFSDNFNVAGGENWDVNAEHAGGSRQAGTIASTPWLQGHGGVGDYDIVGTVADEGPEGAGDGFLTQIDNASHPDKLLLASFPGGGYSSVSPDHNFNVNAGSVSSYLSISFTVDPFDSAAGTNDQWTCINIGSAQNDSIVSSQSQFGILFRDNGGYQAFDSSSFVSEGAYSTDPTGVTTHSIELRLYGLLDGNAFDGSGDMLIEVWADGSKFYDYTKSGGYIDNYITLGNIGGGDFTTSTFDDFSVSVVPEPATLVLMGLGGLLLRRKG